jgi:nicotinamidase-related amidase
MAKPTEREPISSAVHLCLDMQNLFGAGGIWQTQWMDRVLPSIVRLAAFNPRRTVFTRFIGPQMRR